MQNYITSLSKLEFSLTDIHETHKCSEVLGRDLYRISLTWDKENGRYEHKYIYALSYSMTVTGPVSTNLTLAP